MQNISNIIRRIGNKYAHDDVPKEFTDTKTIQFRDHIARASFKRYLV